MPYSLDLRQKVVFFVENGGKITDAAQIFGVCWASIYRWLTRENLETTKVKRRAMKTRLDKIIKKCQRKSRSYISTKELKNLESPLAPYFMP